LLTEADDGRQIGEVGVADALGDGQAGDGEPGDEIGLEQRQRVVGSPGEDGEQVLKREGPFGLGRHPLEMAKGVVGEKRLLEPQLQLVRGAPRGREHHLVSHLQHPYLGFFVAAAIAIAIATALIHDEIDE